MNLGGKTIIITGAASGIGAALARGCDGLGPEALLLLDLDLVGLENVAGDLACGEVRVDACDVSDADAVARCVQAMEARHGRIDLFCANAGVFVAGGPEAPLELWDRAMGVNLMSHVYAARACLPGMLRRGEGYFLHTVSAAGLLSQIGSAPYTVSKHGALAFAEWLSITYGERGIGVTALCPQGVETAMLSTIDNVDTVAGDGILGADEVAACALEAVREERFLALPHPRVADYVNRRASDHERWLAGMRRLQERFVD